MSTSALWIALLLSFLPQHAKPSATAHETYRISGIVVDGLTGVPLSRAEVSLQLGSIAPTEFLNSVLTDSEGRFSFENVAPGKYTLIAQRRGYAPQAYLQHENYWTGIVTGPGLNTEKIRFPLLPSASIFGQVLDEGNEPVRGANVLLFEQNLLDGKRATRFAEQFTTDDEGRFRFGHLLSGKYIVGINAVPWYNPGGAQFEGEGREGEDTFGRNGESSAPPEPALDVVYPVTFFPNARDMSGAQIIALHPGDAEEADLRLQPVPALHLRVKIPANDETHSSGVQIVQILADGVEFPVQTSQRSLGPGLVEVTGLPAGHLNIYVNTADASGSKVQRQSVDLSGNMELDAAHSAADWKISGTVKMDDGGALAPPVTVQLRNTLNGRVYVAPCNASGEFSFDEATIAAGVYEISFQQPEDLFVKASKATGAKASGSRIELEAGKDVRLELTLGKGMTSLSGFALRNEKPVAGAMVLLVPQDLENNAQWIRRDQSDSDGSFTLRFVPPGRYTLVAIQNGWELEWMKPEVLRKYLPGGESVQVLANGNPEVKVKVQ
jgi:5-hydroxyisourate hydrolase-like protein (transthyretin family)